MAEDQLERLVHYFQSVFVRCQPPLRSKHLRIVPIDPVKLRTPRIKADERTSWDTVTFDDVSLRGDHTLTELTQWWKPPKTFKDTSLQIMKLFRFAIPNWTCYVLYPNSSLYFTLQGLVNSRVRDYCQQSALNSRRRSIGPATLCLFRYRYGKTQPGLTYNAMTNSASTCCLGIPFSRKELLMSLLPLNPVASRPLTADWTSYDYVISAPLDHDRTNLHP